jgi:dienelactone hydrolase
MAGRWWLRGSAAALCVLIGALAACSTSDGPTKSGSSSHVASGAALTPSVAPTEAPVPPCLTDAEVQKNLRTVVLPGGGKRQAAEWGSGSVGVLLSHQSDGDLCQWRDYALTLARRGYRALALSYQDASAEEALAAVKALRKDGGRTVVLVGASMGGTISLAAAARMSPPPAAVISLSGPRAFNSVDALAGVKKLRMPLFFAAGGLDEPFASDARTLYRAATHASTRRLLIDAGTGAHGVAFLDGGKVQKAMEAFLARFAPPRG